MISEQLRQILEGDDSGLLDTPPKPKLQTADDRLQASFEEINEFFQTQGREPERAGTSMQEKKLASRLEGLRRDVGKAQLLRELDVHGLLDGVRFPASVQEILDTHDPLLEVEAAEGILTLRNIPNSAGPREYVAKQTPCEDFELFEHLFVRLHRELRTGICETRSLGSEQQIQQGEFVLLRGMLAYVAEVGELSEVSPKRFDARLRLIYENGTESDLLRRSLAKAIRADGRRVVRKTAPKLEDFELVSESDTTTGYIYVLQSLSEDRAVRSIQDLYKIGYSTHRVDQRIKNAEKDPTYFMAPVKEVATYRCLNLNPQKFEHLLHRLFQRVRLSTEIMGKDGIRYSADEWFVVPLGIIDEAVQLIINGEIVNYEYDDATEQLAEIR